jgi:amino acid transporter
MWISSYCCNSLWKLLSKTIYRFRRFRWHQYHRENPLRVSVNLLNLPQLFGSEVLQINCQCPHCLKDWFNSARLCLWHLLCEPQTRKYSVSFILLTSTHSRTCRDNLSTQNLFEGTNVLGMGSSMIPCLWAYDGWSSLNFLAEEMHDFERLLPRAILAAVLTIMACYITANLAYFSVLSQDTIEDSDAIAIDFGREVESKGGNILAGCFALGVALSVAGTCHGSLMTGARAFYATAREGMAPPILAQLNRWNSPYAAVIAQGTWAIVLVLLPGSSFSTMLDYSGPASWLFYALTGSSIIRLRFTEPNAFRPFKVPFYPLPPLLLCAMSLFLIMSSIIRSPLFCILALVLVALSLPVWYLTKKFYGLDFPPLPPLPTESTTRPLLYESEVDAEEDSR